jgi:hypothetical protein
VPCQSAWSEFHWEELGAFVEEVLTFGSYLGIITRRLLMLCPFPGASVSIPAPGFLDMLLMVWAGEDLHSQVFSLVT